VELYGFQESIIKQNAAESHLKSLRPIYWHHWISEF
jgi:hypothetical protein